jgi:phosphatidylinositol kinase/protein kinase (PI-3  family)
LSQISGIEGTFRITCEAVMRVLRENKESIVAVLEAFVHDPLINWRLINWRLEPSTSISRSDPRARLMIEFPRREEIQRYGPCEPCVSFISSFSVVPSDTVGL